MIAFHRPMAVGMYPESHVGEPAAAFSRDQSRRWNAAVANLADVAVPSTPLQPNCTPAANANVPTRGRGGCSACIHRHIFFSVHIQRSSVVLPVQQAERLCTDAP